MLLVVVLFIHLSSHFLITLIVLIANSNPFVHVVVVVIVILFVRFSGYIPD